jgi:hypothetical protein
LENDSLIKQFFSSKIDLWGNYRASFIENELRGTKGGIVTKKLVNE